MVTTALQLNINRKRHECFLKCYAFGCFWQFGVSPVTVVDDDGALRSTHVIRTQVLYLAILTLNV